ncbi:hypothetical protein [uncultured Robinsoniella sp.]|uniref:hypothetical protein n=1 Tax=uncultured Robinsoniella sp. TaxID=904190 RepID=UPI00374EFFD5
MKIKTINNRYIPKHVQSVFKQEDLIKIGFPSTIKGIRESGNQGIRESGNQGIRGAWQWKTGNSREDN